IVAGQERRRRVGKQIRAEHLTIDDIGPQTLARQNIVEAHIESHLNGEGVILATEGINRCAQLQSRRRAGENLNWLQAAAWWPVYVFIQIAGHSVGIGAVGWEKDRHEEIGYGAGFGGTTQQTSGIGGSF